MASSDQIVTALQALTDQLAEQNQFYQQQRDRANASQSPPSTGIPEFYPHGAPTPSSPPAPPTPNWQSFQQARKDLKEGGTSGPQAFMGALAQFAPTPPTPSATQQGSQGASASYPPNVQVPPGLDLTAMGGPQVLNNQQPQQHGIQQNDAITMAMLGEHGAPAIIRNAVLGAYGIQRSMEWAIQGSNVLANSSRVPAGVKNALPSVQGALSIAMNHPLASYMTVRGLQGAAGLVGSINDHLATMQTLGESFGYGAGGVGNTPGYFGFRNITADVGPAARVGMAFEMEKQALQGRIPGQGGNFGAGLTGAQAQGALDVIGNQGFGMNPLKAGNFASPTGDAAMLANGLFRPVMAQTPGLNAQEIGQFSASVRNAGASVETVRDQIKQLGDEAIATKTGVNQFASELASARNTIESMGSSSQGAVNMLQGFTNITGISGAPEMAAQLAQNPMVQGMNLGQYGVLPSAIGDENPGAFAQSAQQTARMLNHALAGIDHNVYRNVNGVRSLVSSGEQARTDQIAQMLGIPSNQVKAWLGENNRSAARTALQTVAGSEGTQGTGGTGLWAQAEGNGGRALTGSQLTRFNRDWQTGIDQHLKGTGISQQQIHKIDAIADPTSRLKAFDELMAKSASSQHTALQKKTDPQTVKVEFVGAAARYFQTVNNSLTPAKRVANAGGDAYNGVLNSRAGDPNASLVPRGFHGG